MATIDSLDLATLTNNPQSIAEALEDVLETTSGNIGSLKTSAQSDHDHIEGLRTSAQSDHDAIETFLGITTAEHHYYTEGFSNSWVAWDWAGSIAGEKGIRIRRMGLLYIVDVGVYKTGVGITTFAEKVLDLGSNITHPSNTVYLGMHQLRTSTNDDYSIMSYINSSGELILQGANSAGADMYVFNQFVGIDVA